MATHRKFKMRCQQKIFFSIFISGGNLFFFFFFNWSRTVLAVLVESHLDNISMKFD